MTDREKAIKGLELCKQDGNFCYDKQCPYEKNFPKCVQSLISDALELLKAQEPRVMTLEEAIKAVSKEGGFVWLEQKAHPMCDAHVSPSNSIYDCPSRKFKDYGKKFIPKKNSFRFMWRCWTAWPTDEQRKAVEWNG